MLSTGKVKLRFIPRVTKRSLHQPSGVDIPQFIPNSEVEMAFKFESTTDCTDFTDFFGNFFFHLLMWKADSIKYSKSV